MRLERPGETQAMAGKIDQDLILRMQADDEASAKINEINEAIADTGDTASDANKEASEKIKETNQSLENTSRQATDTSRKFVTMGLAALGLSLSLREIVVQSEDIRQTGRRADIVTTLLGEDARQALAAFQDEFKELAGEGFATQRELTQAFTEIAIAAGRPPDLQTVKDAIALAEVYGISIEEAARAIGDAMAGNEETLARIVDPNMLGSYRDYESTLEAVRELWEQQRDSVDEAQTKVEEFVDTVVSTIREKLAGALLDALAGDWTSENIIDVLESALAGGAIGFTVGGPLGAIGGAAAGIILDAVAEQFLPENLVSVIEGAVAGGAIGFTVGGPLGLLGGAIAGAIIAGVVSGDVPWQDATAAIALGLLVGAIFGPAAGILTAAGVVIAGQIFDSVTDWIVDHFNIEGALGEALKDLTLGEVLLSPATAIGKLIAGAIVDAFTSDIFKGLRDAFAGLFDAIGEVIGSIWDIITDPQGAGRKIQEIFDRILDEIAGNGMSGLSSSRSQGTGGRRDVEGGSGLASVSSAERGGALVAAGSGGGNTQILVTVQGNVQLDTETRLHDLAVAIARRINENGRAYG